MAKTRAGSRVAAPDGRTFSERLYGIREVHIEVESILQSLAALQDDIPCASCTSVCCKEAMCRESLDSDFLRFLLGPLVEGYSVDTGWHVAGSGCRLSYGRPLVCYEYFCERFEAQQRAEARQLSRAFKTLYADVFAGQHMLVVEDIGRITASKLDRIHARLESLREAANAALRRSLCGKLGLQPAAGPAGMTASSGFPAAAHLRYSVVGSDEDSRRAGKTEADDGIRAARPGGQRAKASMFFPLVDELATTDIVSVPARLAVRDALRQMSQRAVRNIVVEEASGGFGLLTASDVVRLRFSMPNLDIAISEAGYHPLPGIAKGSSLLDVLELFDGPHGYAAVVDAAGSLFGIVSNTDILGSLDPQLMLQRQQLRDLLRRHAIKKLPHDAPLGQALALLVDSDDAVIALDRGVAVGIVTTQDAIRLLHDGVALTDPLHLHMSSPLHAVTYDLTVAEAVSTLREKHFKRLVVQDPASGDVIGIITQQDLIGVAYSRWADLMRHHAQELREIIDVLERKTVRLERIAATDPLTGMANRTRFEALLLDEQQRHERSPATPFSVLLFDIDHFKRINDTWGHNRGDAVLKAVAQHAQSHLRQVDVLARWGGEEFAVLLPQTDLAAARGIAERICRSLAHTEFDQVGRVTASFGVAVHQAGESGAVLLGRADDALYRAKRNGRNRVE